MRALVLARIHLTNEDAKMTMLEHITERRTSLLSVAMCVITLGVQPVLWQSHAAAQQDAAIKGQLYVQFSSRALLPAGGKSGSAAFDRRAQGFGVEAIEKAFPSLDAIAAHQPLSETADALRRVFVVQYTSPHEPAQVARHLRGAHGVDYAEPIYRSYLFRPDPEDAERRLAIPNDPNWQFQWGLPHAQLPDAWDVVKGQDSTALIAIVDGGTYWQHVDLEANVWTNPNEVAGNGLDDDGNGFVDDMHGWNFTDDVADPSGPLTSLTNEHGTAVAGIAAAVTDNSTMVAGASWNARFLAVNTSCANQEALCHTDRGILYAAMNGADVITASFGSTIASATSQLVIQSALDAGALVVAASGNDGVDMDLVPHYPAAYPTTLSVGATGTNLGADAVIFNYGQSVNVFAAGTDIDILQPPDYVWVGSGTSFAVPLVAGVAALVKTAFPSFTAAQLREQVRLTAVNIDAANLPQYTGKLGRGKVDAHAAVTADPLPAIRVDAWSFENQGGDEKAMPGDSVAVKVTFKNMHGDGESLTAELVTDASYVQWSTNEVDLGDMAYGEVKDATYGFVLAGDTPKDSTLRLSTRITTTTFEDRPDLLRIPVNRSGFATHATAGLSVSVTGEGNIGHTSYKGAPNSNGIGFVASRSSGNTRDLLYEGGLLIATSESSVSDCIRESETNPDGQQEDFAMKHGEVLELVMPGAWTTQQSRVIFSDSLAASPIGIDILQESFVDDIAANEDFVLLKYTITNDSGSRIENMHVGLFLDWDLADDARDVTRFDSVRTVGYLMDDAVSPKWVAGTRLLTAQKLHYSGIDNEATIYRGPGRDGFTSAEKWDLLSGGIRHNDVTAGGPKDVSQLMAAGPFAVDAQASVTVAFALISGASESDFLTNAGNAQLLWDAISTDANDEVRPTPGWELQAPYPHPARFPLTLSFETAAQSAVEVQVFDVLGRRVRSLLNARRPGGLHSATWDGRNEVGRPVASGLYLVRMVARSDRQTYVQSQPVVVTR